MCIKPITITNPSYKTTWKTSKKTNITDKYIQVPCGNCSQCIAIKQMEYTQRILMESINSNIFMLTLTYNDEMIPRHATSTGYNLKYADKQDVVNMFKRIDTWRDRHIKYEDIPKIRYFGVTELGSEKGRPHIHVLILVKKWKGQTHEQLLDLENKLYWLYRKNWKRNIAPSTKKPVYKELFTYNESWRNRILYRNYDLHYVNPSTTNNGVADAAWYVLKYLLKNTDNYESTKEVQRQRALKMNLSTVIEDVDENGEIKSKFQPDTEYYEIWNKIKSKAFYSKYFGLGMKPTPFGDIDEDIYYWIRKGIEYGKGKFDYPIFVHPITGETFPLAKYYHKYLLEDKDIDVMYNNKERELKTLTEIQNVVDKWKRIQKTQIETEFETNLKITQNDY